MRATNKIIVKVGSSEVWKGFLNGDNFLEFKLPVEAPSDDVDLTRYRVNRIAVLSSGTICVHVEQGDA